jgi:hypothetical protein
MEVNMKKLMLAVIVASFAAGLPVFADNHRERSESEYYYVNVSLERIFLYRAGYIVQYRKGVNNTGRAYLPREWFTDVAGKGEVVLLPKGDAWPTLSIYYKNGEFSHVRLYVHQWQSHPTWGIIPQNVNLDDHFIGIDTIQIEF